MIDNRGMTEQEANARIASQMPVSEKISRADYNIVNDSDMSELETETEKIIEDLK